MPSMKSTHSCVLHSLVITAGGSPPLPSHASRAESTTPNLSARTFGTLAGMTVRYNHPRPECRSVGKGGASHSRSRVKHYKTKNKSYPLHPTHSPTTTASH